MREMSVAEQVDGTFSLAYLIFNTINNLTTKDGQVAGFQNAAAQLEPGDCFLRWAFQHSSGCRQARHSIRST